MGNVASIKIPPTKATVELAAEKLESIQKRLNELEQELYPIAGMFWRDGKGSRDSNINSLIGDVRHAQWRIHMFQEKGHIPCDFPVIQGIPEE